ncbi:MAG: acyltransferase [Prevotellaceae bacterium]|jgi:surface polysaccharide O-acyltransferase-like enzyme|nr:acyltransferase [Prevotellaceae bacterium]
MLSNDDTTLSRTIMFLRLPLIVAVVFIHTNLGGVMINGTLLVNEGQFPIYDLLHHIVTNELARIAVPLFFFISGFLFFYHSDFSFKIYGQKLKKRIRTLFIPYIFWNIVVFLLIFLTQLFLSSMTSGRQKLISDYDWQDWLNLFWDHGTGMPICYQFWFIRDLIIVILFTPILHVYIKYCKVFGVLALGVLYLFSLWFAVPGFSITAFFFFSFGAWFSINKHDFTIDFYSMRWATTLMYLTLVVLDTWLWYCNITNYDYISKIGIVVGLVAIVSWTAYGIKKNHLSVNAFLAGSSFFVYAYHGMPVTLIVLYWVKLLSPISEWMMLVGYFLIPFFIVGIGVCVYALSRKYFPALTALVTGGR